MTIRAKCEGCSRKYKLPDDREGRTLKCRACGGAIHVPRLEEPVAATPETSTRSRRRRTSSSDSGSKNKSRHSSRKSKSQKAKKTGRSSGSGTKTILLAVIVFGVLAASVVGLLLIPRGDVPAPDSGVADSVLPVREESSTPTGRDPVDSRRQPDDGATE